MQEEGENSLLELPGIQAECMCLRKKHNTYSELGPSVAVYDNSAFPLEKQRW